MENRDEEMGLLSVNGEGQVKAKPDLARVTLEVIAEAKTAAEAVAQNAARAAAVIERMRALGIGQDGLQTVGLSVYPIYTYDEAAQQNRLVGYRSQNAVQVEAPVEMAGKVFDAGVEAGADQSSSLSFALRDETSSR